MTRTIATLTLAAALSLVASPAAADHDYYDRDGDYSNEDRNRNRDRNRGAFSPGPFDDSPVDAFNNITICLPNSTCHVERRPDEGGQDGTRP